MDKSVKISLNPGVFSTNVEDAIGEGPPFDMHIDLEETDAYSTGISKKGGRDVSQEGGELMVTK
jgi:hypothetical protein